MYNETVVQHFGNPIVGKIESADGIGIYMSDFCADVTKFWVRIAEGKIIGVRYRTQGCAASEANLLVIGKLSVHVPLDLECRRRG